MYISLIEKIRAIKRDISDVFYCKVEGNSINSEDEIVFEKGFFFILCTNGTTFISDFHQDYILQKGDLLILTPSIACILKSQDRDFSMICLYIVPDYFDCLPEGEPMYQQLTYFLNNYRLPILHLGMSCYEYLLNTATLFANYSDSFSLHKNSIVRHLCSFYLLLISDILYRNNKSVPAHIKRSNEIFRNFKKLLVLYYRKQHSISFYASKLNISTTYLSRIVKKITGRTVCFHISELICSDAKYFLECTDMDIKEITHTLGFSDQSAFGKFFLKKTGCSPLKFRQKKVVLES